MNSQLELLTSAKKFVDDYRLIYTDNDGKLCRNSFPEPRVPTAKGVLKELWNKTYSKLKPNELKYIIKHLHNLSEDMLMDTVLAYLRYYKTKRKSEYQEEFEKIYRYYEAINENQQLRADPTDDMKLYLLEICIGASKFYKVGVTTNIYKRVLNIRSDVSTKYDMLSTSVNIIGCWVEPTAEELEASFKDEITTKCKYFFVGSSEAFESKRLRDMILHKMRTKQGV